MTGLKDVAPSAVIHSSVIPLECQATTQPVQRAVLKLPAPLTSLQNSKYASMTQDELKVACKEVFSNGIRVTLKEAEYLEESTRLQSHCLHWHKH